MILNLFRFFAVRNLMSSPVRTLLTLLGVALGIALFSGVSAINASTLSSFKESVDAVAGKSSLTVSAGDAGFSEQVEEKLKKIPGVRTTAPMIESKAYYRQKDGPEAGKTSLITVFGIDLLKEQSVRTYQTEGGEVIEDPLEFLNQPDSIILTKEFAKLHDLKVNDAIELASAAGSRTFVVRGLLSPTGPAKAYGGAVAIMDIDGARVNFGKEGKVDRIDLVLQDSAPGQPEVKAQVAARAREILGEGYQVEAPETQSDHLQHMVGAFQGMLSFLSALALMIGMVLVANSVSVAITERRQEIGTLRALGATRAKIFFLILGETLVMGSAAGLLGALLGNSVAHALVGQVSQSLASQSGMPIQVRELHYSLREILHAMLLGTSVSVAAAFWPARKAMNIPPMAALKARGADLSGIIGESQWMKVIPWLGAAMLVYLFVNKLTLNLSEPMSPALQALQPALGVIGSAMVAPWVIHYTLTPLLHLLKNSHGSNILVLRMALENLLRAPSRTLSNVLSLLVGLMLVIIVSVINISFKNSVSAWTTKAISVGDMALSSNGRVVAFQVQPLHESVLELIKKTPGVDLSNKRPIVVMRYMKVNYQGDPLVIKALDPTSDESGYPYIDALDRTALEAGHELFSDAHDSVLISENLAKRYHKKTGEVLELDTPTGRHPFAIAATIRDFASPNGVIYLNRNALKKYWKDNLVTIFFLAAKPGVNPVDLQNTFNSTLGKTHGIVTILNTELVGDLINVIDQSFSFNKAVQLAALLVGLIGLLNTMLVSIFERTREFGMLRAVGMDRRQLSKMVLWECLAQGSLGVLAAVVLGTYLSWLWVTVNLAQALGWVIHFSFPTSSILQVFFTGVGVALIAGILPVLRASQLTIRKALEHE
ncbi:MAG: FtsX-like permease family protein [Methylotenera sp.]|nr:FtsX-like permease family protein [Oligoflexia bacterium]